MSNILVIGSNGYVGSALTQRLSDRKKHSVIGVDLCVHDKQTTHTDLVIDYKYLTKDFLSMYDVVILLAAHSSVKMCEGSIIHSHKNNVDNFITLVNKLDKKTKFIYASSSSVYGKNTHVVDETHAEFIPYNNYDITKHIIDLYIRQFDIEYYGLRFGTVNGYAPITRKDVMINAMYSSAIHDKEIKLYIKNIMRPILGMQDLVRAVETIIESESNYSGIYNLASFNKTAEEIAIAVSKNLGIKITEYIEDPNQPSVNIKLQTMCYDFQINTARFETTFDFKFTETINSIVDSLKYNSYIETTRNAILTYA